MPWLRVVSSRAQRRRPYGVPNRRVGETLRDDDLTALAQPRARFIERPKQARVSFQDAGVALRLDHHLIAGMDASRRQDRGIEATPAWMRVLQHPAEIAIGEPLCILLARCRVR